MTLLYAISGVIIGAIATVLVFHYQKVELPSNIRIGVYALWAIGLLLILFACCWGIAAVEEGVPQSMAMGFLVFGGIGAICAIIGYRLGLPKAEKPAADAE